MTNDEILRELMFHPEIEVEIRSADDNNEKQIADIQHFIDEGFDLIIADPNETKALTPIISKAYRSGIPVITFDRRIDSDDYTVHIEVDNAKIGTLAARYALNDIPASHPGTSAEVRGIIELSGDTAMSPARLRHKGFVEELARNPRQKLLASVVANWNPETAARATDSLLRIYPGPLTIYAHSDLMAIEASKVAKAHGRDNVDFIGIDGIPSIGLEAVADSTINATFIYNTYGYKLLQIAHSILKGDTVPQNIFLTPMSAVDRSNVDILLQQNTLLSEEDGKLMRLRDELDGYWSIHRSQTNILYATIAIAVLLAGLLFLVVRSVIEHRRHNRELIEKNRQLEQAHRNMQELYRQLDQTTQSKVTFYTNVSHDLRTPLTLIAEPLKRVIDEHNLEPAMRESLLKMAYKNVKVLQRLTNQILDLHKIDDGKLILNLNEVEIFPLAKEWVDAFRPVLKKKNITLSTEIPDNPDFSVAIDSEKMERVFFNLMSNAIKFTPAGGSITVKFSDMPDTLTFTITDTGEGISEKDVMRIFERFYQTNSQHTVGSGIGLSLAKGFVELHHGSIRVSSTPGVGSTFTVSIPIMHTDKAPAEPEAHSIEREDVNIELGEAADITPAALDSSKPLMLVIDDNRDLQQLISGLMSDDFSVICASNGRLGVSMAVKYTPDIVICDVMMPGRDGLECCSILKNETSTSHIPVLMLTACGLDEQRLQGYKCGADGYLTKPFTAEMLKARINNLIENRKRIKDIYNLPVNLPATVSARPKLPATGINPDIDNDFYNHFLEIVMQNISDPDLSIDYIADKIGLSKSQVSRKIKALTNHPPVEIIRNIRLNKARQMLTTTEKTISEISYETGFRLPAYFSKCYREAFGETPSELRNRLGKYK